MNEDNKDLEIKDIPTIERLRKIKNFDFYWRIALLLLLVVATTFMFIWLFRFSNEGMDCRRDPFVWGAARLDKVYGYPGVFCSCNIGDSFETSFTFNEERFNPNQYKSFSTWRDYLNKNVSGFYP